MSVLHFFRANAKPAEKEMAKGEGTPSKNTFSFSSKITSGKVNKSDHYDVYQGNNKSNHIGQYQCTKGADHSDITGGSKTAEFTRAKPASEGVSVSLDTVMALQQTLAAVTKKVIITIDEDDLQLLKKNNYKLCFAKKVGDADYNVVWQSYKKYLSYNEFSWTPQYQLFGTNTFNAGVKVVVSTNAVNIGLGQLSKLNEAGVLSSPVTGGPETGFTMVNEYGSIHPGVKQLCTGIDGTQTSSPIYVSTATAVQGKVTLTPVEKVLVWFEQEVETSTMFSNARSNSIELDLTTDNSLTRHYADQKWVIE